MCSTTSSKSSGAQLDQRSDSLLPPYLMDKQQQFIAMVQTAFLANAINTSLEQDAMERRHEFSASGALIFMDEALRAAQMIPENMSSVEAAHEFADFMLNGLREEGAQVPGWFARP